MNRILSLAAAVAFLTLSSVAPTFAVDNTISKYCRADQAGNTYQRPGGFCDAVANNKTMLPRASGGCPVGYVEINDGCVLI